MSQKNLTRLPCAGKLGNCPQNLHRFHFTCLYCRMRRRYAGKYATPPQIITYQYKWSIHHMALVNENGQILAYKKVWRHLNIDAVGHFVMFRCAVILVLDRVMQFLMRNNRSGSSRKEKFFLNLSEFFANYPTW